MCVCVCVCVYVYIYIYIYIDIDIEIYRCRYRYIYRYIVIYTYIYTHTTSWSNYSRLPVELGLTRPRVDPRHVYMYLFGGTNTRARTRAQARGATPEPRVSQTLHLTAWQGLSAGRHSTQTAIGMGGPSLCVADQRGVAREFSTRASRLLPGWSYGCVCVCRE